MLMNKSKIIKIILCGMIVVSFSNTKINAATNTNKKAVIKSGNSLSLTKIKI